ncbi:MAG: DinB family protein [Balneolaceae bacterium]
MKHSAIQQYDYHAWANRRFFDHLASLPQEIYNQPVKSVFSTLQEVLVHIYQTDTMWLSVMSVDPFEKTMAVINEHKEKSAGSSLDELKALYEEAVESYTDFFDQVNDPDENISIHHPRNGRLETPVAELVRHVVNHGTYHRGNITAMLRQMGHTGIPTDYVFYLYDLKNPTN